MQINTHAHTHTHVSLGCTYLHIFTHTDTLIYVYLRHAHRRLDTHTLRRLQTCEVPQGAINAHVSRTARAVSVFGVAGAPDLETTGRVFNDAAFARDSFISHPYAFQLFAYLLGDDLRLKTEAL